MAEALLLAAVVAGAIVMPQILFGVKDEVLHRGMELSRLERADMELLEGDYEKSMHRRMGRFAEGLTEGERFYAASKNLDPTEELTNYLYSEKGLYQEFMFVLMNLELIYAVFWEWECKVSQWKQYTIYSDNYGEGISFLLWYIELQCGDDMVMKLLADGETGSIYGVKTEGAQSLTRQDSDMGGYRNAVYETLFYNDNICDELLCYLMICYEAQSWEKLYEEFFQEHIYSDSESAAYLEETDIRDLTGNAGHTRGGDFLSFQLPYEDAFLEFRIDIGGVNVNTEFDQKLGVSGVIMYPDVTAGIRQLYELIPEFARTD